MEGREGEWAEGWVLVGGGEWEEVELFEVLRRGRRREMGRLRRVGDGYLGGFPVERRNESCRLC